MRCCCHKQTKALTDGWEAQLPNTNGWFLYQISWDEEDAIQDSKIVILQK